MRYYEMRRDALPYVDPTNILRFFYNAPLKQLNAIKMVQGISYELKDYSLFDYLSTIPQDILYKPEYHTKYHNALLRITQKLVNEGLLSPVGINNGIFQKYRANGIDHQKLDSRYYDFLILGFPEIKIYFEDSVRPIVLIDNLTSDHSIGSSFTVLHNSKQYLITARHCLPENSIIQFQPFLPKKNIAPEKIFILKNDHIDIAVLEFSDKLLLSPKFFELNKPYVLDKVMTMGFPPIQGTIEPIQIASSGEITAITNTYWHDQKQILISSKVKGGNSGGPVINHVGEVVGILTNTLVDPKDSSKPDELGFGLALSSEVLISFLEDVSAGRMENYETLNVIPVAEGFQVKYNSLI